MATLHMAAPDMAAPDMTILGVAAPDMTILGVAALGVGPWAWRPRT